jgi:membrane protein YqaA with SNARE-associated domain
MTITYKSATFDLTTTNVTTILTVPSNATVITKAVQAVHDTASNVNTDLILTKSGDTTNYIIGHAILNASMTNLVLNTLNLEAGDILKMQASTANEITGVVTYALIDRSNQNG